MAIGPKLRPQNRKRQHAEANLSQDDVPSKKLKSTREHRSASNFPPEFYDSLSKVSLTRRALRELDRRNQIEGSVCVRALAHKPLRRFSKRKDLQRLRRFARFGGPELGDLRGYPEPTDVNLVHTMSSKRSSRFSHSSGKQSKSTKPSRNSTSETSNTEGSMRRSSAYNEDFEQHLADHGIYPEGYEYPDDRHTPEPDNLEEIRQRLALPRPSLSPSHFSESAFRDFKRANARVIKEGDVMRKVLPTICGDADIPNQEDLLFTRLESITNEATVDAKPDFYDGAPFESIDKQVREDLGPYIIPTGHQRAPVAPNFFLEAKAPSGGADVAKRQITHDLSLGARGMHKLQSYAADKPAFDNNAYTLGATYHGGNLNMYASHVTPSGPGGSPEYHVTQVDGWNTIGNSNACRQGAAALRHGREMTKEYRDNFISAANERARYAEPSTLNSSDYNEVSTDAYSLEESQTSADEVEEPSQDELATSFYPAANSFSYPATSYRFEESGYNDLSDVIEELETSADELALDTPVNPPSSKKRPIKRSENIVSKAPRHNTGTSHRKHRSKK